MLSSPTTAYRHSSLDPIFLSDTIHYTDPADNTAIKPIPGLILKTGVLCKERQNQLFKD